MKKWTALMVVGLIMVMVAPAMAADVVWTGQYRVRGFTEKATDFNSDTATSSYLDMRLRVETIWKVNDKLDLTTRFDALDGKRWGAADKNTGNDSHNIDWDRAYMTYKTDMGMWQFGRMLGSAWGTTWADSGTERDRIKYVLPVGPLTMIAIYEKTAEGDENNWAAPATAISDGDVDSYFLAPVYKMENVTTGVLFGYIRSAASATQITDTYIVYPYFEAKFGPLALQGEVNYKTGTVDRDTAADSDINAWAFNVEGAYNMGPLTIGAGYAFMTGDDGTDNDVDNFGVTGDDWEKVWILTNSTMGGYDQLGGLGNLDDGAGQYGLKMPYVTVDFQALENLSIGALYAFAQSESVPAGWDDKIGNELDVTVNWKITKGLSYSVIGAWLDPGDFWKQGVAGGAELDNAYAIYQKLQLNF